MWMDHGYRKVQIPLPRKGTETLVTNNTLNLSRQVFKFHYPARGRKPSRYLPYPDHSSLVQIPLPRKGTETLRLLQGCSPRYRSNSITPQGDGNSPSTVTVPKDGAVQIPLPRKGTETSRTPTGIMKNNVQIPLPRKGTETLQALGARPHHSCSNSITPQGDGNTRGHVGSLARAVARVQIPLPRKGTETMPPTHWPYDLGLGSNSITPQGDGNQYPTFLPVQ